MQKEKIKKTYFVKRELKQYRFTIALTFDSMNFCEIIFEKKLLYPLLRHSGKKYYAYEVWYGTKKYSKKCDNYLRIKGDYKRFPYYKDAKKFLKEVFNRSQEEIELICKY